MSAAAARARIALCYGTRPQVIKASALRRAFARHCDLLTVDTGQHYDFALNELLYQQLGVEKPDLWLDVGSASHDAQTATILTRSAAVFREHSPQAVVVIGDTNSTLGCALAAAKMRIPVVHVEAGLRVSDALMAEEINRRAVDAISSLLCAPSDDVVARLEQAHPTSVVVNTGDVARDVLAVAERQLPDLADIPVAHQVLGKPFIFTTLHRAELTDDPTLLRSALDALTQLELPVLFAAHPRTLKAAEAAGISMAANDRLIVTSAVGYFQSLALTRAAAAVVTDSGGVQREAYWMGTPCITVRDETEWQETLSLGANRLVAPARMASDLAGAVAAMLRVPRASWDRTAYGTGQAAEVIVRHTLALLD